MNYPKKIMTTSELVELGYTRWMLRKLSHVEGQVYAFRRPGGNKIFWDTEKLEKMQNKCAVR